MLRMRYRRLANWLGITVACLVFSGLLLADDSARRARVKDVASIEGIRENQLVGYGLVVGLRGI